MKLRMLMRESAELGLMGRVINGLTSAGQFAVLDAVNGRDLLSASACGFGPEWRSSLGHGLMRKSGDISEHLRLRLRFANGTSVVW